MKSYKLIKDYPLVKMPMEVFESLYSPTYTNSEDKVFLRSEIEDNPEFWQEVKDQHFVRIDEFEILEPNVN